MTLTNALLFVPTDLEPLRKSGRAGANVGEAYQSLTADMLRVLICVGADLSGAKIVNGQPDWSVTMPRLAAWADLLGVEQ